MKKLALTIVALLLVTACTSSGAAQPEKCSLQNHTGLEWLLEPLNECKPQTGDNS